MKILLVSHYFWPESFIISDLVECLVAQGHNIEVITGKPNYPGGTIYEGYSASGYTMDYFHNKVVVHRVPILSRGKGGASKLFLNYFSFILSGLFYSHRLLKLRKLVNFDVIFVFAPSPITSVIPAIHLKRRLKIPLVVWVQDLWPESLSATGYIKNKFLINIFGGFVRWIYTLTDTLLIQSQAFQKPISQYTSVEKTIYYPNSYIELPSRDSDYSLISKNLLFELEHNFCLVFAGNMGTAQSLITLIEVAELIKHLTKCKIILIGSGSMHDWIKQQITARSASNIILAGQFPARVMPHIFARAAGLLVTLKRDEIFSYTIPSKIQAYLAAGRPIIAALDGEGARIIDDSGAGFTVPAEDAITMAETIEKFYHLSHAERDKLGKSGRSYFLKHFEMLSQSQRLIEILEETIRKKETS